MHSSPVVRLLALVVGGALIAGGCQTGVDDTVSPPATTPTTTTAETSAEGNAGFSAVTVNVHLDAEASPEELAALHEKVTSTVGHTLARALPVDIVLA